MARTTKKAAAGRMKNAPSRRDDQLREFERRDLGAVVSSAEPVLVRPQNPTSILLSEDLKAALRRRGRELGVGYQTAAKMILAKYINAKL